MKKVLKICTSTWENASRDKRELSVCRELGAETVVLAKGNPDDKGCEDEVDDFKVYRYTTRPIKSLPNSINRILSLFTWAQYAATLNADVISGHDIIGLLIGWMSVFFSKKKPILVYDSHEFEIGRNVKRSALAVWAITHLERFLIKKCAFSIMVNDSIADEVQRIHNLKERPIVVRNIPNLWRIDEAVCQEVRKEILSSMGGGHSS